MAVIDRIPMPGTGFDGMIQGSDWMHKLLMAPVERRYKESEMEKAQQANQLAQQMQPLKMDLLRAQIQSAQSLANQRNKSASAFGNLSKANITKNQGVIQAIDNVTPLIGELKSSGSPGQLIGKYLHPNSQADYEARTGAITDSLVAALGLPKTNESLHLIGTMVKQKPLESTEAYHTRLDTLVSDLTRRKQKALTALQSGIGGESDDSSSGDLSEIDPLGVL